MLTLISFFFVSTNGQPITLRADKMADNISDTLVTENTQMYQCIKPTTHTMAIPY